MSAAMVQFLNPGILVKKPGKLPEGHINSWFWERGNMRDTLPLKLPGGGCSSCSLDRTCMSCLAQVLTPQVG
jgi:hypothetical protein